MVSELASGEESKHRNSDNSESCEMEQDVDRLESYTSAGYLTYKTANIHPNGMIDAGAEAEAAFIRFGGSPNKAAGGGTNSDNVKHTMI